MKHDIDYPTYICRNCGMTVCQIIFHRRPCDRSRECFLQFISGALWTSYVLANLSACYYML